PGGSIQGENLSVWHEGHIPWRQGDRDYNGVFLGWNRAKDAPAATYTLTLPTRAAAQWQLGESSTIELSVAALDEDAPLPGKKSVFIQRSEEHTSELQSPCNLVCRLLLEKKKKHKQATQPSFITQHSHRKNLA